MIVDAQVHIWRAPSAARPWPSGGEARAHRAGSFLAAEVIRLMDRAGVDRCVLVPPSFEGSYNDLVIEACAEHPRRFAAMGKIDASAPGAPGLLRALLETGGIKGLRLSFIRDMASQMTDGTTDWLWRELDATATPVMLYAPHQDAAIADVVARHPRIPFVIDHLNLPVEVHDQDLPAAIAPTLRLAEHDNVAVKVSGLASHVSDPYPFPSLDPIIGETVERFGAHRVFWGSDLTRLACDYRKWLELFTEGFDFLSSDERRLILGDALLSWLRWENEGDGVTTTASTRKEGGV